MRDDPKPILFDGFEKAFVGMLRRNGQTVPIALYDYNKCMEILMERDGMDDDEAVEWLEVNTLGAYLGETTPAMLLRCTLKELNEEWGDPKETEDERDYGDEHPTEETEEMSEEEQAMVDEAIQNFALNFIKYVREVDSTLYNRAKQYAADFSGNAVVEFIDGEDGEDENGD